MYFNIIDWAGNVLFNGRTWPDWETAEEFLSEILNDTYDDARAEYYINGIGQGYLK